MSVYVQVPTGSYMHANIRSDELKVHSDAFKSRTLASGQVLTFKTSVTPFKVLHGKLSCTTLLLSFLPHCLEIWLKNKKNNNVACLKCCHSSHANLGNM